MKNRMKLLAITLLAIPMASMLAYRPSTEDRALYQRFEEAQTKVDSIIAQAKAMGRAAALIQLSALKEQLSNMPTGNVEAGLAEHKNKIMEKITAAENSVKAGNDSSVKVTRETYQTLVDQMGQQAADEFLRNK